MEEDLSVNAPWYASVLITLLTVLGGFFTAFLGKKRLETDIAKLTMQVQKVKDENERIKKEADQIKTSYLEIVQKLKTLRDFEIGVDGKDIAKLLNKGL